MGLMRELWVWDWGCKSYKGVVGLIRGCRSDKGLWV